MKEVETVLRRSGADWRRVADGEWGVSLDDVGGWPLHLGVAQRGALLRLQAAVCAPGQVDPHALLHRNRSLSLVRFAETRAGEVWLIADTPVDLLDRALGTLVDAAADVRAGLAAYGSG